MEIVSSAINIVLTGVVSYLIWFMQQQSKKKANYNKSQMVLMRVVLKILHKEYTERGWISLDEYEEYNETYEVYTSMGGNGTGTRMKKDIDELELRR